MRFVFLLLLTLVAGCTGIGSLLQKPEVSLAGVELLELNLLQQRFAFKLLVRNPNQVDLPITRLNFEIEINGQPFATGVSDKATTVPRSGEAILPVTAESDFGRVLRQVREWKKNPGERVEYRVHGTASVAGFDSLPFDRRGELHKSQLDLTQKKPASR